MQVQPSVEQMTAVVEPVSLLLQQACGPCLCGDLAGAVDLIDQAGMTVAEAQVLEAPDLQLWQGFARHLVTMWALPNHWEILIKLLRSYPWEAQTHSHLLHGMHFLADTDMETLAEQHRRWARLHVHDVTLCQPPASRRDPDRPLRIGYVSPDFRVHCVAHFFEPLLQAHDRSRFVILGYGNVPPSSRDELTGRLASEFDQYRDIWGQNDRDVVEQIQSDRIDILVDLAGHTHHHRLGVFAAKPAPIQVTYLGYPSTTGLETIDYRITDTLVDEAESDRRYSETLVRLNTCFACYRAPEFAAATSEPPVLQRGHVTFGSFVGAAKHNPMVVSLWSQVLAANPGSTLLLRFQGAEEGLIQQQCRGAFARHGIAPERIQFDGLRAFAEHLNQYRHIDIALDTTPWSSHTSLCEALWMGVPVVTWAGPSAVSRLGASVLDHLGTRQWVAHSARQYVETAFGLARDVSALVTLRHELRQRMQDSALCDGSAQARAIEAAYREMWLSFCAA